MQIDSKNNLILNIKNKTQLYPSEIVKKALEEYEKNKIATNEVSFCANHDRDTEEAINNYYKDVKKIAKYYFAIDPYYKTEKDSVAEAPAHYNNEKGSLYEFCERNGINSYEFDIIKRVMRCRKKGLFEEDLKKTKFLIDLYLKEFAKQEIKENNTLLETHTMD
jgi:hypothetical protein